MHKLFAVWVLHFTVCRIRHWDRTAMCIPKHSDSHHHHVCDCHCGHRSSRRREDHRKGVHKWIPLVSNQTKMDLPSSRRCTGFHRHSCDCSVHSRYRGWKRTENHNAYDRIMDRSSRDAHQLSSGMENHIRGSDCTSTSCVCRERGGRGRMRVCFTCSTIIPSVLSFFFFTHTYSRVRKVP